MFAVFNPRYFLFVIVACMPSPKIRIVWFSSVLVTVTFPLVAVTVVCVTSLDFMSAVSDCKPDMSDFASIMSDCKAVTLVCNPSVVSCNPSIAVSFAVTFP